MNTLRRITLVLESSSEAQFYTYFHELRKKIKELDEEFKTSTDLTEETNLFDSTEE